MRGLAAKAITNSKTSIMIKKYLFLRAVDADAPTSGKAILIGVATPEEIKDWKAKYNGKAYSLEVDGHIAYFRNPNRTDMNISMSKASIEAPLDMYEMLAKLTKIGGSEDVLTDDDMFFGITQQLKVKMDGKKAILVNL